MRARIFDAAAACLAEKGYHGASLGMVVARAGASQGALQHHFPAKVDLMAGLADYLLHRSIRWFARAKADVGPDGSGFNDVLARSWREQFATDEYAALVEILVAARTDEALRRRVTPMLTAWRDALGRELAEAFPQTHDKAAAEMTVTLSRALMTGLILHEGLIGCRVEPALEHWAYVATLAAKAGPE